MFWSLENYVIHYIEARLEVVWFAYELLCSYQRANRQSGLSGFTR